MKNLIRFVVCMVVSAFILAGGMVNSAAAADKAAAPPKAVLENDKVKVFETMVKPGETITAPASTAYRVVRALQGSKIERTYADGKKEAIVRKTGDVYWLEPGQAYSYKNTGKTALHLYVVQLK